ncbi:hypothetical protein CsSME_00051827 [Camellia sinensis var. sinensis]
MHANFQETSCQSSLRFQMHLTSWFICQKKIISGVVLGI